MIADLVRQQVAHMGERPSTEPPRTPAEAHIQTCKSTLERPATNMEIN